MNAIAYARATTIHDDIVERSRQMRMTLASLRSVARTATCMRARAIDESLATLQTHLGAGWDANDSAQAAALTHWLDRSRFLYDVPSPADAFDCAD
jgi:conjugal transfer/entry exclusion protein